MNPNSTTPGKQRTIPPALAAALVLAIGMGFGRFAFTGLYPLMVRDGYLTVHSGTLAASANYAGYLIGALMLAMLKPTNSRLLCMASMIATVTCLAILFWADNMWVIIAIRGLAGIVSAVSMVAASMWLMHDMGHQRGAPTLYAGVGVGIVLSAELIALGHAFGLHSAALWMVLALSGLLLVLVSTAGLACKAETVVGKAAATDSVSHATSRSQAFILIVIYGLAGFGYIITATYLPLLIKNAIGPIDPVHVWALFGLGAIPSCFVWHAVNVRLGTRKSLALNLTVQAIGVALPALSHSGFFYIASAFLVGGTFLGTVTIVMPAARHVAHAVRFNMMAGLTAVYGVGQIIGPLVANAIYVSNQSFAGSLWTAAAALLLATAMCRGI